MYLQLVRKTRKIKALFIHSNERQTNKGVQETERKARGERERVCVLERAQSC